MRRLESQPRTRDLEPEEPQEVDRSPPRAGNQFALVVGIDAYPRHPLQFAVQDAKAVAGRLAKDFGFQVTSLLDHEATAEAIGNVLVGWQGTTRPDDDVLFFFAGHGRSRPDQNGVSVGYLMPFGASDQVSTWLVEVDLIQQARRLPARRVFLIFDACYSGAALHEDVGVQPGAREDQVLKILVAGTESQPVLDGGAGVHSVFTKALLDGLDGLADAGQSPDGIIDASELITFVRSEVPWRSQVLDQPQTPVGGWLQGAASGNDFQFRPAHARLSASLLRNLRSDKADDRKAAMVQLADLRGGDRATLAADELIGQLHPQLPSEEKSTSAAVRLEIARAAAAALGALGHPKGFAPLTSLLRSDTPNDLRAAAAAALGTLAAKPEPVAGFDPADSIRSAIQALIQALLDPGVREAAKDGLSRLPGAAPLLIQELRQDGSRSATGKDLLDTLAWIGDRSPQDPQSWLALPSRTARLWRRYYLARRRILPHWLALVRSMVRVGLFGAVGLALAYGVSMVAIWWGSSAKLWAAAALSVAAPFGLAAGATFAALPFVARCLARRPRRAAGLAGAVVAGLALAVWMGVPNWFVGIGVGNRAASAWLYRLLPGLVLGPLLGLALEGLPWKVPPPPESARSGRLAAMASLRTNALWILLVTVLSGVVAAAAKICPAFSLKLLEPHSLEVLWWGVGGAFFGASLAVGWCTSRVPVSEGGSIL